MRGIVMTMRMTAMMMTMMVCKYDDGGDDDDDDGDIWTCRQDAENSMAPKI